MAQSDVALFVSLFGLGALPVSFAQINEPLTGLADPADPTRRNARD